jgi:hypothetical protein
MKYKVVIYERDDTDTYYAKRDLLDVYVNFEEYEHMMLFVVDTETGAFEIICNESQLRIAAQKLLYKGEPK